MVFIALVFQYFKNVALLPSDLHGFWWEIHACLNYCLPVSNIDTLFSLVAFKIISFCLVYSSWIFFKKRIYMWISLCLNLFSIHWASWICSFIYFAKFGRFSAVLQIFFSSLHFFLLPVSWVCSFFPNLFLSVFQMGGFLLLLCHIRWHFSQCSAFSHWTRPVKFFKFLILYPLIPKFVFLFCFFK